jgi:hypothetical protein
MGTIGTFTFLNYKLRISNKKKGKAEAFAFPLNISTI